MQSQYSDLMLWLHLKRNHQFEQVIVLYVTLQTSRGTV